MPVKKYLLMILLSLAPMLVYAQGGSNYSIYGIGDLYMSNGALYDGLGGVSSVIKSDYNINTTNPALWSRVTTTRLQVGYRFNQNVINSSSQTLAQNNSRLQGILSVFAVDTSIGLGISFGLSPLSQVNYLISSNFSQQVEDSIITGTMTYQGSGGLSRGYIGLGCNITSGLSAGLMAAADFGSIIYNVSTQLNYYSTYPTTSQKIDQLSGFTLRGGLFYDGINNLALASFYEWHGKTGLDNETRYYSNLASDTAITSNMIIRIPDIWGVSASYELGKFLFAGEYVSQDYSNFNYRLGNGGKIKFKPYRQYGFGISRLGNPSLSAHLVDRISYSLGLTYKELYYSIAGQDMKELSGAFGMGIPIVGTAMLNTAFTVGKRGTKNNGLIEEWFGRLTVDISIGDSWFKPFKREN